MEYGENEQKKKRSDEAFLKRVVLNQVGDFILRGPLLNPIIQENVRFQEEFDKRYGFCRLNFSLPRHLVNRFKKVSGNKES